MDRKTAAETEIALQKMVTIYVVTGLLFLLLPGTFLGVWNLVSISGRHSLAALSASMAAGARTRSNLRLDWYIRHWNWLLFPVKNGRVNARRREPRMGQLVAMDRRRNFALGGQCHGISMACTIAGLGGAPVDCVRDLLRDRESSQSAAGRNQTGSDRDVDEAGHRGDRCVPVGPNPQPGRDRSIGRDKPNIRSSRTGWISVICFWRRGAFLYWQYGDSTPDGCRCSWALAHRRAAD